MNPPPAAPAGPSAASGAQRLARALLALFFRRVEVTGRAELPERGGGLLIAWHPNGLIDPALVLATFPGRVVFGARHGLFRWPLLGRLMRSVAVPIYRRQDLPQGGDEASARRGNEASLGALAAAIATGSFAMLFPEGDSHDESHPLELKTGAARLFLDASARARDGAAPDGGAAPAIVPVGLHYDQKGFFRSRALVTFHAPLDVSAEVARPASTEEERRDLARRLTARFAAALDAVAHATDDWRDHHLMHRLRRLVRAERARRAGASPGPVDMRERQLGFARIWTAYRELGEDGAPAVVALRKRVGAYDRLLRRLGLEDHELDAASDPPHGTALALVALQRLVLDGLFTPLLLIGLVANLPTALLLAAAARFAARRKKDLATIKLLLGAALFPATWLAIALLAASPEGPLAALFPRVELHPELTAASAFVLSALGGVLLLAYGRLSRRWGRALLVRAKRRLFGHWVGRLLAERASIFDDAIALSVSLALPGRVGPAGEIMAEEAAG